MLFVRDCATNGGLLTPKVKRSICAKQFSPSASYTIPLGGTRKQCHCLGCSLATPNANAPPVALPERYDSWGVFHLRQTLYCVQFHAFNCHELPEIPG
jgi:hypothetical protein